jgi:hypothetical protein
MNFLIKLACATLAIVLVANANTAGKTSTNEVGTINPFSGPVTGWSAWKYILLARNGVESIHAPKDFHDTQFEYRWKSERTVNRYVRTVEIRDVDDSHTVPEIDVYYSDRHGPLHFHAFTAHDVPIGKQAHAYLRPPDCESVDLVFWKK